MFGGGGGCTTPLPAGTPEIVDGGSGAKTAAAFMAAGEAVLPRLPLGPIMSGTCTFGCAALNCLCALSRAHCVSAARIRSNSSCSCSSSNLALHFCNLASCLVSFVIFSFCPMISPLAATSLATCAILAQYNDRNFA